MMALLWYVMLCFCLEFDRLPQLPLIPYVVYAPLQRGEVPLYSLGKVSCTKNLGEYMLWCLCYVVLCCVILCCGVYHVYAIVYVMRGMYRNVLRCMIEYPAAPLDSHNVLCS